MCQLGIFKAIQYQFRRRFHQCTWRICLFQHQDSKSLLDSESHWQTWLDNKCLLYKHTILTNQLDTNNQRRKAMGQQNLRDTYGLRDTAYSFNGISRRLVASKYRPDKQLGVLLGQLHHSNDLLGTSRGCNQKFHLHHRSSQLDSPDSEKKDTCPKMAGINHVDKEWAQR